MEECAARKRSECQRGSLLPESDKPAKWNAMAYGVRRDLCRVRAGDISSERTTCVRPEAVFARLDHLSAPSNERPMA